MYYSSVTKNGNSSYSTISQESADRCADYLDMQNCRDCVNCRNCTDCRECRNCSRCVNCINCSNCSHCRSCISCLDCTECTTCTECTDCAKQPIQITGGAYIVTIRTNKTIKIGCKDFPVSIWEDDSPNGIASQLSTSELELWNKSKYVILALAHLTS